MDERELIKSKIDLVEFINSFVPLKKKGRNFSACCPFHNERTPSFVVSPERQIFKCFGCQKGGDVFSFLMEYEKMGFGEAIRTLADKTGVKLAPLHQGFAGLEREERDTLFEINHLASEFYTYVLLNTKIGKCAMEYLTKRGVTKESINLFKIGYAPNSWDSLTKFLVKKGYKIEDLIKSGVAFGKNPTSPSTASRATLGARDRFYGRLMFSLFDHRGNCVGFAGRILETTGSEGSKGVGGKYINTAETPVYHKSEVLYGFNITKDHVRKEDCAVVVEGEIDLIKAYQAGTKNVVAIKGSALTEQQVALLKRFTQNLKICLDTDLAGKMAAIRGIQQAERADLNIKVIELLFGKDPDECITHDIKLWKKSLDGAHDVSDFYINLGKEQFDLNEAIGKKRFTEFVFPKINAISNLVVRDHYVKKLARLLDASGEVISQEMEEMEKRKKMGREIREIREVRGNRGTRREQLEENLLALILQSDDAKKYIGKIHDLISPSDFKAPVCQKIASKIFDFVDRDVFTIQHFAAHVPPELAPKVDELYLKDLGFENLLENIDSEIKTIVREIRKLIIKEKTGEVLAAMRAADEESPEFGKLNSDFQKLTQELKKIE